MKKHQPYGDTALLVTFGNQVSEGLHLEVQFFLRALEEKRIEGVLECFAAYSTVTIVYDFLKISYSELVSQLEHLEVAKVIVGAPKIVRIPVCYHAHFSWDMDEVMKQTVLTKTQVVKLHTTPIYLVYMLGFTPGFFYLGGLDDKLRCSRKENPRLRMEEGAVGIAGMQTGVYSVSSPGGWQIIGKTPVSVFDKKDQKNPFLVKPGDCVQFYEISWEEYKKMQR
jgi:inhibitor of KinA